MYQITQLIFCALYITQFSFAKHVPPVIVNSKSEVIIEAKDNLTLICEGQEKITWTFPNNTIDGTRWSKTNIETLKSNEKYIAKLFLNNASFIDVGYYYCHAENATNYDKQSAKIYVFVRDEKHLSTGSKEIEFITAFQDSEINIPCRPTSPDISVSLFDIHEEQVQNTSYNIYEGFKIKLDKYDETYICIFKRQYIEEEIFYIISIVSRTTFIPKPFINSLNDGKTSIGATYILNCTVTVDQNVYFTLNWKIPNSTAEQSGRIVKTAVQTYDINGVRQGSSTLTIKNVQFEDGGEYTCNIVDHNQKNNSVSKNITVFDTEGSYINLQEESGQLTINTTAGSQAVQWVVTVDSFPTAIIEWKNNKGDEITRSFKNHKYFTDYNNINNKATLKINQITLNDTGIYQIIAKNGKTEKKLDLILIVQDRPVVDIKSNHYHDYGKNTTLECIAVGFPIPTVEWLFKPCENNSCDFQKLPKYMYTTKINGFQTISTLTMNATVTGSIQCFAANAIGNNTYTKDFYITDVKNGLHIWSSVNNYEVASGSNIELNCAVSKYNYEKNIVWYIQNEPKAKRKQIFPNEKYQIKNYTTAYSFRSMLTINNITKSNTTMYICETKLLEYNNDIDMIIPIIVQDPNKPVIHSSNINGSTYTISVGDSVRWYCRAFGIPSPTIIWKKDNYDLAKSVNHSHIKISEDNTLLEFLFVQENDEGTYSCEAKNSEGTDIKTVKLEVINSNLKEVKPNILKLITSFYKLGKHYLRTKK